MPPVQVYPPRPAAVGARRVTPGDASTLRARATPSPRRGCAVAATARRRRVSQQPQMGDKDRRLQLEHAHARSSFTSATALNMRLIASLFAGFALSRALNRYQQILGLHAAARRLERAAHFRLGKFRTVI